MSRKTIFWMVLIIYVAAMGIAAYAAWQGRNLRTLPVLETTTLTIPTLEEMQARCGEERAQTYLTTARQAIAGEGRFRLKEDTPDIGGAGDAVTLDMLGKLEEKGVTELEAWDIRGVLTFCKQRLTLAESLQAPGGAILRSEGQNPEPDSLFQYLLARNLTLDNIRNGAVEPQRIYVKGRGSIVGLNSTMFMVGVNFVVLVILLYVILWQPVTRALDERAEAIKANIDTTEERRRHAEELFQKRRDELREARDTREGLRRKGEQEGQEERVLLVRQAQEEVARIRVRADEEIEADRIAAREQLTREIGGFSVTLASAVLKKEISEEHHNQLIEEFIASLTSKADNQTAAQGDNPDQPQ